MLRNCRKKCALDRDWVALPQRTNEFQQLVHFIEERLAGSGATVTESKLLADSVTGEQREVDIVIEIDGPATASNRGGMHRDWATR